MINLFIKTGNGKYFRWIAPLDCNEYLCSEYLCSWTGPDRSAQVQTGPDMPPRLALAGPDMPELRFLHENVTFSI